MASGPLPPTESAVLEALVRAGGKVVSRATIVRDGGLGHLSTRRTDAAIVALRRLLGADSVITVRQRGWRLDPACLDRARAALEASL